MKVAKSIRLRTQKSHSLPTDRYTLKIVRWLVFIAFHALLSGCIETMLSEVIPDVGAQQQVYSRSPHSTESDKIAVLVEPRRGTPTRGIEDEFISVLLDKGYNVSSRSDVEKVVKEISFQKSGLTDLSNEDAAEIGKILNVPSVIIVHITDLYTKRYKSGAPYVQASMGARIVKVETAEILWVENKSSKPGLDMKGVTSFINNNVNLGVLNNLIQGNSADSSATLTTLARKLAGFVPSRM